MFAQYNTAFRLSFYVGFAVLIITFCVYRLDDGVDITLKQKTELQVSEGDHPVTAARGLVTTDAWADGTPAKKVQRSDSAKKEKRQRTLSLKTNKKMAAAKDYHGPESPSLADMEGMLERKHLHQSGGKMATVRSWKHYYTVLAGQLLCFFKDHHGTCFCNVTFIHTYVCCNTVCCM